MLPQCVTVIVQWRDGTSRHAQQNCIRVSGAVFPSITMDRRTENTSEQTYFVHHQAAVGRHKERRTDRGALGSWEEIVAAKYSVFTCQHLIICSWCHNCSLDKMWNSLNLPGPQEVFFVEKWVKVKVDVRSPCDVVCWETNQTSVELQKVKELLQIICSDCIYQVYQHREVWRNEQAWELDHLQ